jgi:hypothetical protein
MPVVVLLGARQTGKTTLVKVHPELADRPYLTLDDLAVRLQAEADPEALVARAPALVLDEVQRAADLLIAIKRAVDRDRPRRPGRFVLTGSANLLMLERIGESLAGRAVYVTLWPLTQGELAGQGRTGLWSELLAVPAVQWPEVLTQTPRAPPTGARRCGAAVCRFRHMNCPRPSSARSGSRAICRPTSSATCQTCGRWKTWATSAAWPRPLVCG